jgi:GrpB-like predicted nucleotidyltransferase (UPF0157 family)
VTDDEVRVVPYDPDWPGLFEAERGVLEQVLAPWLRGGVHHVGSTAVAGLASKPIIDMIAGVRELDDARAACGLLHDHSYLSAPHRPEEAHHFVKPSLRLSEMTHSLHLTQAGGHLWRERLAFRNALRADPALAREYEGLKRRLAGELRDDVASYTDGKRAFVGRVLAGAGIELQSR